MNVDLFLACRTTHEWSACGFHRASTYPWFLILDSTKFLFRICFLLFRKLQTKLSTPQPLKLCSLRWLSRSIESHVSFPNSMKVGFSISVCMQGVQSPTFSYFLGIFLLFPTFPQNSYFFLLFGSWRQNFFLFSMIFLNFCNFLGFCL